MSGDLHSVLRDLLGKGRLQALAISANGFAFDPRSGQSFTVNHTGVATVEKLLAGNDVDATVAALTDEYDVPAEVVLGAVEVFVRQLARYLA
jgi:hypothetical protein